MAGWSAAAGPADDEPFADEDRLSIAEADEWLKQNEPIPLETILSDFGLTSSDWERMAKVRSPEENNPGNG